jgi:3-methylcrotonyl-CoA carboxylase alpha subunit
MAYEIAIDGLDPHLVTVTRTEHGAFVYIDEHEHRADLAVEGDGLLARLDERRAPVFVYLDGDIAHVHALGRTWRLELVDPAERSQRAAEQADVVAAPMPGSVVSLPVGAGEAVALGEPLIVIESMKMQSELVATREGIVARLHVAVGDTFDRGAALVTLEPEEGEA